MKGNKGFTLVETMVTVGLVGVIALGIMRLQSNMNKTIKSASTKFEVIQIHNEIYQAIADPYVCENLLSGENLSTGVDILEIREFTPDFIAPSKLPVRDGAGNLTGTLGGVIVRAGHNKCQAGSHTAAGTEPCVYGSGTGSRTSVHQIRAHLVNGSPTITVTYRKGVAANKSWHNLPQPRKDELASKSQFGRVEETKTIPLTVEYSGATVSRCNSLVSDMSETFCISLGGTWVGNKCTSINIEEKDTDPTATAITATGDVKVTENLEVVGNGAVTGNLTVTDYTKSLSFSTDPLNATAGQVNTNALCLNGNCISPNWQKTCGANSYQTGTQANGNPNCTPIPNAACGPNEYVQSVAADGTPICAVAPQFVTSIACGSGYAIRSANLTTGAEVCVTPRLSSCSWVYSSWVGTTSYSTTARGATNALCPSPKVAAGARVETTNSSTIEVGYTSGAVRMAVYCCNISLQP